MNRGKGQISYSRSWVIMLQDSIVSVLSSLLAIMFARWISEPVPGFSGMVFKWLAVSFAGTFAGMLLFRTHKVVRRHASVRSTARILGAMAVKAVFMSAALLTGFVTLSNVPCCILAVLSDIVMATAGILFTRVSARLMDDTGKTVFAKAASKNALVVWAGDSSVHMAGRLEKEGYNVAGFLSTDPSLSGRVIADKVVFYCSGEKDLDLLQWKLGGLDCIFFPSDMCNSDIGGGTTAYQPDGYASHSDGMSFFGHVVKRAFDVSLSGLLLIVFSPLMALCAILVKLEDGGPAIYAQERLGRGGKPFKIYKFRSMRTDAEATGAPALYSGEADPRLTRAGRFLRAHHLDELPQLWNVFRGDMSFIGYRPERKYYIDQIMSYNPRYRYLYQIRPGVTSYATLYNGYTDTLDKMLTRLDLDLYYLRNHSLWFDTKVLGLTFLKIVTGRKF